MICTCVAIRLVSLKVIALGLVLALLSSSLSAQEAKVHLSREHTLAVESGRASDGGAGRIVSRQLRLLVDSSATPAPIRELTVTLSSDRASATLDWSRYHEVLQHDVCGYHVFLAARPLYAVQGLEPLRSVPAGTHAVQIAGLDPSQANHFAVVAVDCAGRLETQVQSVGAYPVFPTATWRELTLMVGASAGREQPISREIGLLVDGVDRISFRHIASREVAVVNATSRPPESVASLQVARSAAGDRARLDWSGYNEVAQKGIAFYRLFRSETPLVTVAGLEPFAQAPAGTKRWEVTDLNPHERIYFAVVPVNPTGLTPDEVHYAGGYRISARVLSREVGLVVDGVARMSRNLESREWSMVRPDQTPPAAVTKLAANGARVGSSVLLDWSAYDEVGQTDVLRYHIYGDNAFFDDVTGAAPIASVSAGVSTYLLRGLEPGRRVFFAVVAEDVLGNFDARVRSVSAVALDAAPPSEIIDLQATPTDTTLRFSWRLPPSAQDLNSFRVRFGHRRPVSLTPEVLSYEVSDLLPAKAYDLRITTVDSLSNESDGVALRVVTLCPNPTRVHAFVGMDAKVELQWEAAASEGLVRHYAVFANTTDYGDTTQLEPRMLVSPPATRAMVSGLENGTAYYFAVATVNAWGHSASAVTTVRATPNRTDDIYENNDRPAQAAPIEFGRTVHGELLRGDTDHFLFTVPLQGHYRVVRLEVEGLEQGHLKVAWLDARGRVLEVGDKLLRSPGQPFIVQLRPGASVDAWPVDYALRIERIGGDAERPAGAYPRQAPPLIRFQPIEVP